MTCDVDCGSSGLDVAGMACGSGGDGDGDDMGGDDNDDDMMDPAVTCNFADFGWTCDDGTKCTTDPNGDTLDQNGAAGCDTTCASDGQDVLGNACGRRLAVQDILTFGQN